MDRLFVNGTFRTLLGEDHVVSAVGVKDGVIVATGSRQELAREAGAHTEVIDVGGAVAFPGFSDTHTHLLSSALANAHEINFSARGCRSLSDVLSLVQERAQRQPAGTWIRGVQLREEKLDEQRYPTRHDLDTVAPDHSVYLLSPGDHVACINSHALRLGGIERDTAAPSGGSIDRDAEGEPTGILRERAKLLVIGMLPQYTLDQASDALAQAAKEVLLPAGITCFGTIVIDHEEIAAHRMALDRSSFPVRTKIMARVVESKITLEDVEAVGRSVAGYPGWLDFGGVKMSIDGDVLQRNGAVHAAYRGEPENFGLVRIQQDELDATAARAASLGRRNVIHAIGDRAYDMALRALELVFAGQDVDHRSRIEHFGNLPVSAEQIRRARALGVVASPQPQFFWTYGDRIVETLGEERARGAFPFRSLLDAGIPVIGSSDYGMTPTSPLTGVQAAVTRRTEEGTLISPEEAITPYEALLLYTLTAAYADFDESWRGRLQPGYAADLTFLAADPLTIDTDAIATIATTMTVVDGQVAFAANTR